MLALDGGTAVAELLQVSISSEDEARALYSDKVMCLNQWPLCLSYDLDYFIVMNSKQNGVENNRNGRARCPDGDRRSVYGELTGRDSRRDGRQAGDL